MAIKVFPSANGVGGAGQKVLSENNLAGWMTSGARNYVISGLEIPYQVAGAEGQPVIVHASAGAAMIAGYYVVADAPVDLGLPTTPTLNKTYMIYLRLTRDGIGLVSGVVPYYSLASTPPEGDYIFLGAIRSMGWGYSYGVNLAPHTPRPSIADTLRPDNLYYSTFFDSADGFAKTGTVTAGEQHLTLTTAATSGATASIRKKLPQSIVISMNKPIYIRMGIGYDSYGAISGYCGIGTPASKQFLGISYRDGYIYGCRGKGSSLVETAELSTSGGDNLTADEEICITMSGGSIVWQATRATKIEADTYLPTSLGDGAILYAEVKTTNAAAKSMYLSHYTVAQWGDA